MAMDLPAPPVPLEAGVNELRVAARKGALVQFGPYRLHWGATRLLGGPAVVRAVDGKPDLSAGVLAIARALADAGYPAAQVFYAADGKDVYLDARPGRIKAVVGERRYARYFDGVTRQEPVNISTLARATVLAGAQSERAGVDVPLRLEPDKQGAETLVIGAPTKRFRRSALRFDFSNFGNRYSGRYLVDLKARQSFASGDEVQLIATSDVPGGVINEGDTGPFRQLDGEFSRVTPYGVFGIDGGFVNFKQTLGGFTQYGHIRRGGLSWLAPIYADADERWSLNVRLDRNHQDSESPGGGKLLQQQFNAGTLATRYAMGNGPPESRIEFEAALEAERGFGEHLPDLAFANLDYFVLRQSLSLKLRYGDWQGSFGANGQYTEDVLPQAKQFVLGGPGNLYAFVPGYAVGDEGFTARLAVNRVGQTVFGIGIKPGVFVEYGTSRLQFHPQQNEGAVQVADAGALVTLLLRRGIDFSLSAADSFYSHGNQGTTPTLRSTVLYFRLTLSY